MNTKKLNALFAWLLLLGKLFAVSETVTQLKPIQAEKRRVLVSTDIGGTDPDDFQSMVHLFLYLDVLEVEGLISSPYGPGSKEHILEVIQYYEQDYPNLILNSTEYPAPDSLRSITKQGEIKRAPYSGFRQPTEGSQWLIQCARREDQRPLHVLIWGGIEDLAQALHDAPDIKDNIRVYWIGGPNKKWSPDAYQYIAERHSDLWIIESNSTYRGWFTGGDQTGDWSNEEFASTHISGHGALGRFFTTQLGGIIKMGDSPSVAWVLNNTTEAPDTPGWGGQYTQAWKRPYYLLDRMPAGNDKIEVFGILELALSINQPLPEKSEARLMVENQKLQGSFHPDGTFRVRFCPKAVKRYEFKIESNIDELNGRSGEIHSIHPEMETASKKDKIRPNWWTDLPDTETAEGDHWGAKTVSRWRKEFLNDFANRIDRCLP